MAPSAIPDGSSVTFAGTTFYNPERFSSFPWLSGCYSSRAGSSAYRLRGRERRMLGTVAFQYTLSGFGIFRDGRKEEPLPRGRCFLVEVCRPHLEYFYPAESKEPWSFLYCNLTGGGICEQAHEIASRHGHVFDLPSEHPVIQKLSSFLHAPIVTRSMEATSNALLVAELLSGLVASARSASSDPSFDALVRNATAIISGESKPRNVTDLAEELGVSREHLTRVFRRKLNRSPGEVLEEARLESAKVQLQITDRRIEDVALSNGYKSASHFGAMFKRLTGMPPGTFRRIQQGGLGG